MNLVKQKIGYKQLYQTFSSIEIENAIIENKFENFQYLKLSIFRNFFLN